jgi:uncharacterized MAPEG superfamily protein
MDLYLLAWSALLCLLLVVPIALGRSLSEGGLRFGLGNRQEPMKFPAWVGRAERAHTNMVENLAPFAALVLTAHALGRSGQLTTIGAMIFFWARVAHAASYLAGIVYLRTIVFWFSVLGDLLIFYAIVR